MMLIMLAVCVDADNVICVLMLSVDVDKMLTVCVDADNVNRVLMLMIMVMLTVCGGHLVATAVPQMIYSHAKYGDMNYDNRADCTWRIQAEEGFVIQLRFRAFELEDEHECA